MTELIAYFNNETNAEEVREMTPNELAEFELTRISFAEEKATRLAEAEAKAAQKAALLDRLGITEDEAKLLLA